MKHTQTIVLSRCRTVKLFGIVKFAHQRSMEWIVTYHLCAKPKYVFRFLQSSLAILNDINLFEISYYQMQFEKHYIYLLAIVSADDQNTMLCTRTCTGAVMTKCLSSKCAEHTGIWSVEFTSADVVWDFNQLVLQLISWTWRRSNQTSALKGTNVSHGLRYKGKHKLHSSLETLMW